MVRSKNITHLTRDTSDTVQVSLDIGDILNETEKTFEQPVHKSEEVENTIITADEDPRVITTIPPQKPELKFAQLLEDGLGRPFVRLMWKSQKADIDRADIIGFNVFRRRVSKKFLNNQKLQKRLGKASSEDKLAKKMKNFGKFASNNSNFIVSDRVDKEYSNENLSREQRAARLRAQTNTNSEEQIIGRSAEELNEIEFKKIGFVEINKFTKREKLKKIFVSNRNETKFLFDDKNVRYDDVFEYVLRSVSKTSEESFNTESILIEVANLNQISSLRELKLRNNNKGAVKISAKPDKRDDVDKLILYRKSETEPSFRKIGELNNITSDEVNIVDSSTVYTKSYQYRVFVENIHGVLSNPTEAEIFSSVNKITSKSRSNTLKVPVFDALQDDNSNFIKVIISPNDNNVAYYELTRRDLTLNERNFLPVSKHYTGFGGDGWETNRFFVKENDRPILKNTTAAATKSTFNGVFGDVKVDSLKHLLKNHQSSFLNVNQISNKRDENKNFEQIIFIDDTVDEGHIYQYRVSAHDLFGNTSSYSFDIIRSSKKKTLRAPINLDHEIVRGHPFRIKLKWTNDNIIFADDLLKRKIDPDSVQFLVQRRKVGENVYESFPLVSGSFLVDEVASTDAIEIDEEPEVTNTDAVISNISRRFNTPDYMKEGGVYYYRVAAVVGDERSSFSNERKVLALADLSNPINFNVSILNKKVLPLITRLTWSVDRKKSHPDHWLIERKEDETKKPFKVIGRSYIKKEFLDRDVEQGRRYIYRIKSIDLIGRESRYFEARITT